MTDEFVDPGEPGELTGMMKSKDLINKPLIIRPRAVRHDGQGKDDDGNPTTYSYVNCDVWVLDRAGVVESGTDVQFSWKRVIPQLADRIDKYVAGTPRVTDNNSRVLEPFTDKGKEIARRVIGEIKAGEATAALGGEVVEENPPEYETGEEPF